jgi:hypothetical protein
MYRAWPRRRAPKDGLKAKRQALVSELLELNCGMKLAETPEYEIHWH